MASCLILGKTLHIETVTVLGQQVLGGDYHVLQFASEKIARRVKPGQFIHLRVAESSDRVLRRPFSVFKAGKKSLSILYKIVGNGTKIMAQLRPGDKVSMMGPLGNGFPMPSPKTYPLFIAGGYGSAALYLLAERLKRKGTIFIGGKTADDILCVPNFKQMGWDVRIATEDGSSGQKGLVTDVLIKYIRMSEGRAAQPVRPPASGGTRLSRPTCEKKSATVIKNTDKSQMALYACGPMGMLKAVAGIALASGWKAWLSLDRHMGCGVGACLACVQKIRVSGRRGSADSWKWARICTEGPVFECREIVWE